MAASAKKKVPRKVAVVRVICIVIAVLMVLPVLLASLVPGGGFW